MAFKLTYSDGQESQHDDDTVWEIDDGVLKLGRKEGQWSVLLSPNHWAVLELSGESGDDQDSKSGDRDKPDEEGKEDKDEGKDRASEDDESDHKDD